MSRFRMGEWVMVTSQKGKKWYVKIEDAPFSSHLGTFHMLDVVGKQEGDFLETHKGAKMYLFRSTLEDYIFTMNRPTQVIYPKDLGAMVLLRRYSARSHHPGIRHRFRVALPRAASGAGATGASSYRSKRDRNSR